MKRLFRELWSDALKTVDLARRFGGGNLGWVSALSIAQGLAQMAAVGAVVPFLSFATASDRSATVVGELIGHLPPGQGMLWVGTAAVIIQAMAGLLGLAGDFARARFAHFTAHRLADALMAGMASQPYSYHLRSNVSVQLKRLRDDVHVFLTEVLLPLLDALTRASAALLLGVVLLILQPVAALFCGLVFGGAYILILYGLRGRLLRANRNRGELVRRQFHTASELLQHIKLLIVHGARDHFVNRYAAVTRDLAANESPVSVLRIAPRTAMETIAFSALIGFVLWMTARPDQGERWIPLAGAFALCGYRLLPSLSLVYSQMVTFITRRAVVDELIHTLQETQNLADPGPTAPVPELPFQESLRLRMGGFSYPGQNRTVLGTIDLVIPQGSHAGIVGPTGAGKSTLLDLLLGLHVPDQGGLHLDDVPVPPEHLEAYRSRIGYVPQDVYLLDDTIRENILFGLAGDDDRILQVARAARIDEFIRTELPEGYETRVGERGVRLSGGQRQRIALARALYRIPEILILDEATSALDQETERAFLSALDSWKPRLTVITVAHRPAAVRHCDRIHVMDHGSIVASGTFPELERSCPLFRTLVSASPSHED